MKHSFNVLYIIIILSIVVPINSDGQDTNIIRDSLYSTILKEQRTIQLVFPENYDPQLKDKYELFVELEGIAPSVRFYPDRYLARYRRCG